MKQTLEINETSLNARKNFLSDETESSENWSSHFKENVRLWRKENLNLGLACHRDAYYMRAVGLCRHDAEELCIHISLYSCWVS
jgi:hypothetical protein